MTNYEQVKNSAKFQELWARLLDAPLYKRNAHGATANAVRAPLEFKVYSVAKRALKNQQK